MTEVKFELTDESFCVLQNIKRVTGLEETSEFISQLIILGGDAFIEEIAKNYNQEKEET